jgi:hypothetical protein
VAVRRVVALQDQSQRLEAAMRQNSARIERMAMQKSREVLLRMGVIRQMSGTMVAPPLKPLPHRDDWEGLEEYFAPMRAYHRGENAVGRSQSVELDSNIDVANLHGEEKQKFVRNVAKSMGVADSQVKLILGLPDTPHPTPRR